MTDRAAIFKGGDNGPAAVPSEPEASLFIQALRHLDEPRMLPKKRPSPGEPDPTAQPAVTRAWRSSWRRTAARARLTMIAPSPRLIVPRMR